MKPLSALFSPLALIYGLGAHIRNALYDRKWLKSTQFSIPIISIGNLTVGGTGKTPHAEYLIRNLQPYIDVGFLSRGYKRKSIGFIEVNGSTNAAEVGDEPLLIKRKNPEAAVAVGENRALAIPQLIYLNPEIKIIVLDDAFQHRAVNANLNLLITEYNYPFFEDFPLPVGRLREWRNGYQRADIIIVSKCPPNLSEDLKSSFISRLNPLKNQNVYFTRIEYGTPYGIFESNKKLVLDHLMDVVVITGIAKPEYLVKYLQSKVRKVHLLDFPDHHYFSNHDIGQLTKLFKQVDNPNKIILTTEKDALRLEMHKDYFQSIGLMVYTVPIEINFLFDDENSFNSQIRQFILDFKS